MRSDELNDIAAPGRHRGERRVLLTGRAGARASGLWFERPGARAWVDLHDDADPRLLGPIARALGPGGAIMVAYGPGETERALRRKVPAAATPLGLALMRAGCRWLKDWYFAEGGREGHAKLEGELPLDEEHRQRAEALLRAELTRFLSGRGGTEPDRATARAALAELRGQP